MAEPDWAKARAQMVAGQLERRGVREPRVLDAMRRVPRHLFVPPDQRAGAYEDRALPIGNGQTISQPYMVAIMSAALGPVAGSARPRGRYRVGLSGGRPRRACGRGHHHRAAAGAWRDGAADARLSGLHQHHGHRRRREPRPPGMRPVCRHRRHRRRSRGAGEPQSATGGRREARGASRIPGAPTPAGDRARRRYVRRGSRRGVRVRSAHRVRRVARAGRVEAVAVSRSWGCRSDSARPSGNSV